MYRHSSTKLYETSVRSTSLVTVFCLSMLASFCVLADTHQPTGANIFLTYCSGCHGIDGFAAYEHAPSFSMGERLQKDDRELLQSVLNGKNNMPPWKDKLQVQDLRNAIAYIRVMHERQTKGEPPRQDDSPDNYFLFKPVGEQNMDWKAKGKKK